MHLGYTRVSQEVDIGEREQVDQHRNTLFIIRNYFLFIDIVMFIVMGFGVNIMSNSHTNLMLDSFREI